MSHIDELVTCPYNKSHKLQRHRFSKHLKNCRSSYSGDDIKLCKFNPQTHHFPEHEILDHERTCENRLSYEIIAESNLQKRKSQAEANIEPKTLKRTKPNENLDQSDAQEESQIDESRQYEEASDGEWSSDDDLERKEEEEEEA